MLGAGPKDQVLAEVTNTKEGVPGPKDQEVKMGTRRRYSASIYTRLNNSTMGAIVRKRNKGIRENNRTTIIGQWENRWGINEEQWGDSNGDAKCVRGPMGEFTRMVRYRRETETSGDSWNNR